MFAIKNNSVTIIFDCLLNMPQTFIEKAVLMNCKGVVAAFDAME